jgi:hypothetical protein
VRGQELKRVFTQLGLQNVRVDKVGNVLGDYPGAAARPHLVLAAHLDTVFPEGTDVKVKREGNLLKGPGIGDDCRGLAVMVAIVREMKKANVKTPGSITFVANVGEEGLGDLRGVKELFKVTLKDQIDRFVSIDGTGVHVTNVAVGSHRYRVTFKGPAATASGAFGMANPMGAMGRATPRSRNCRCPSSRATFNVRPDRRRHVGELDSVRRMDGSTCAPPTRRRSPRSTQHHEGDRRGGDAENALGQSRASSPVLKELVGRIGPPDRRPKIPRRSCLQRSGGGNRARVHSNLGEGSTDSNTRWRWAAGDYDRRRRPRPRRARSPENSTSPTPGWAQRAAATVAARSEVSADHDTDTKNHAREIGFSSSCSSSCSLPCGYGRVLHSV